MSQTNPNWSKVKFFFLNTSETNYEFQNNQTQNITLRVVAIYNLCTFRHDIIVYFKNVL